MIGMTLPEPLMLALRWALLLGPLALVLVAIRVRVLPERARIGGLFAFLYGVPMIFITHLLALHFNWWQYGWDALMLNGLPADIIIGGAVLFGPGLYFAFPKTAPLLLCLPVVIGLHGTMFTSLEPLVFAGPFWFAGVLFVFATAHIPAIYLAKWTCEDRFLPLRCIFARRHDRRDDPCHSSLADHASHGRRLGFGRPSLLELCGDRRTARRGIADRDLGQPDAVPARGAGHRSHSTRQSGWSEPGSTPISRIRCNCRRRFAGWCSEPSCKTSG